MRHVYLFLNFQRVKEGPQEALHNDLHILSSQIDIHSYLVHQSYITALFMAVSLIDHRPELNTSNLHAPMAPFSIYPDIIATAVKIYPYNL